MIILLLVFASFAAGFIDSIAGGGGLILVPSLLLSGLPPQLALGTNKFISSTGTGFALLNFIRGKKVLWKTVAIGLPFTFLGTLLGARAILAFNPELVSKIIIALLPIATGATLLPKNNTAKEICDFSRQDIFFKIPIICLSIGFYDGFFGPGTGTFFILAFHWFLHVNLVHASGTAKVFNFASNIGALAVFLISGKVLLFFALPLVAANIIGGYLGSHLTIKKGAGLVRIFLLISLVILLISLITKYLL